MPGQIKLGPRLVGLGPCAELTRGALRWHVTEKRHQHENRPRPTIQEAPAKFKLYPLCLEWYVDLTVLSWMGQCLGVAAVGQ